MSGLLVVTPVAVTIWLLVQLLLFLDGLLYSPVKWSLIQFGVELKPEQHLYGPGLVALFLILLLIGWIARLYIGKKFFAQTNDWFEKLPIIRTIYSTIQPLSRAVFGGQEKFFREVVWTPFGGGHTLGFVIGESTHVLPGVENKQMVSVYLPLAPPTTGFLMYYPRDSLTPAQMSVEDGLKLLFSFGVVQSKGDDS